MVYRLVKVLFPVTVCSLLGGCEVAPARQQSSTVYYPSQPAYGYEDVRRCRADNQRAHAEAFDAYQRASQAGRIDPAEAQRFNAMDARLRNLHLELSRDGLTWQECQRIGAAIAREREEVRRMSAYDSAQPRCMADNRRAHDEIYRVYNDGVRSGRIDPVETKRFQAIDGRLRSLQADLRRDGVSLAECQRIGRALAQERAAVNGMIR